MFEIKFSFVPSNIGVSLPSVCGRSGFYCVHHFCGFVSMQIAHRQLRAHSGYLCHFWGTFAHNWVLSSVKQWMTLWIWEIVQIGRPMACP